MIPLQKIDKEWGPYRMTLYPEATRQAYETLPAAGEDDVLHRMLRHHLPRVAPSALRLLEEMGLDLQKLPEARPLSEPDENGELLFLCSARLCGTLHAGGDITPRQSVEEEGVSMIFVGTSDDFRTPPLPDAEETLEIRFVLSFLFDPTFFDTLA